MSEPAFSIRGFNLCESLLRHSEQQLRRFIRRMKTLQMNRLIVHYDYGWNRYKDLIIEETAKAGVDIALMAFGPMAFFGYVDWNPNWFARKADGSLYTDILECETQPCRFQPEAIEAFAYGAKQWLVNLPDSIQCVHMRSADGLDYCQCPQCAKLSNVEKWQPFVEVFVDVVAEVRPKLKCEVDAYVQRYDVPDNLAFHQKSSSVMYDTFARHPQIPLGFSSPNKHLLETLVDNPSPKMDSPNIYHASKIKNWCRSFPGKIYIHENAMAQSFQSICQHNTSVLLKDLEFYHRIGVQGVCYEAYEPGYINFEQQFETLAQAMIDLNVAREYRPTAIEQALANNGSMEWFCEHADFPANKYLKDSQTLTHITLARDCRVNPTPENYRNYVDSLFERADVLDPLFCGFFAAKTGVVSNRLDFTDTSDQAQEMLKHRKLWDFMEKIPNDKNPVSECKQLILDLADHVKAT